ncbi:MAG: hypothetical protein J5I98_22240 [Phaeodactylibacter sp.]|nr:hypothetical protein [Phaeodactylibacter sp.]
MEDNPKPQSQKVQLSDGTVILMEISGIEEDGPVSVQEMEISAKRAFKAVSSLAKDIKATLAAAKPDKASVEFSVELEKQGGDILSKICNVSGKGGIKFTLEWDFSKKEKE